MAANNHSYVPLIPPPDYTPRSTTTATSRQQCPYTFEAVLPPYSPSATAITETTTTTTPSSLLLDLPPRPVSANSTLLSTPSSHAEHNVRRRSASPPRRLEPLLAPPASAWPSTNPSHNPSTSRPVSKRRVPEKFYTDNDATHTSSSFSAQPSTSSSSSFLRNPLRSIESYRRDRESRKKVDYYERVYGFVPKNVMSEAEWRAARDAAPKEGPRIKSRGGPMFGGALRG